MKDSIYVVVPWRQSPERIKAFKRLKSFYTSNFKSFNMLFCDSAEEKPFNRSAAVNSGIRQAIQLGAKIIIINDADSIPEVQSLLIAIAKAAKSCEIVVPYNIFRQHKSDTGDDYEVMHVDYSKALYPCSGTVVVPSQLFIDKTIDFFEEKIDSWGPEDQLFHKRYIDKVNKTFVSVSGVLNSLYTADVKRVIKEEHAEFYREIENFLNSAV